MPICLQTNFQHHGWTQTPIMSNFSFILLKTWPPVGQFHNEECNFFPLDEICLQTNSQHPGWTQTPTMSNFSFESLNKLGPLVANFIMRHAIFSGLTKYACRQIFSTLGGPKLQQCPISNLSYYINWPPGG